MIPTGTLVERLLPDYRARHIFTTKLRLMAFIGFLAIYLYFLRDVLGQTKYPAIVVIASFFITGLAYGNVMNGRWLLFSFGLELFCDLNAIAAILYLTGGPFSPYYVIYLFYVFLAGVLYNHRLAAVVGVLAVIHYLVFLILCTQGIIPPLMINFGDNMPVVTYGPYVNFTFALIFLAAAIYTAKTTNYFAQQRERVLETRNRELTALNKMSSTIRSATSLRDVIDKLINGVLEGLNFETAILVHFDWSRKVATVYTPGHTERLGKIESILGRDVDGLELPISALPQDVLKDVCAHRVIFRRELAELALGVGSFIDGGKCRAVQDLIGARRIVVMPIVAEREALGALVGFSREPFVEETQVDTLESFANQSALSLEAATLIARLKRVNEELKEANQVKSEFLATMSHELRTPLTAIIGFSELMLEGVMGDLNDEQKDSLREVLHNAADLLELINTLLDLTKIESGKMRLDVTEFELGETVGRQVATITPLVQKKEQELVVDLQKNLPQMSGDERKIGQTILNLLANANKFTAEGGRIGLKVRAYCGINDIPPDSELKSRLGERESSCGGGFVEVSVEDNGVGIEPGQLEKIFEMFHQQDNSATRSFGGTGVGLALAKKFTEMHGGTIWAVSEPGRGAKFTAAIPIRCFKISS